jgi:hypothetical protein
MFVSFHTEIETCFPPPPQDIKHVMIYSAFSEIHSQCHMYGGGFYIDGFVLHPIYHISYHGFTAFYLLAPCQFLLYTGQGKEGL